MSKFVVDVARESGDYVPRPRAAFDGTSRLTFMRELLKAEPATRTPVRPWWLWLTHRRAA